MQQNDKLVVIYATFPTLGAAKDEAEILVSSGLVACANIIPGMLSVYRWEGRMRNDDEVIAILKTRASLTDTVIAAAKGRHPYDNPAFLVLSVDGGSDAYAAWVLAETSAASRHQ